MNEHESIFYHWALSELWKHPVYKYIYLFIY